MKLAYVYGTEETVAPVLGATGDPERVFPWLKENGYCAIEPFVRNPNLLDHAAFEKAVNRSGIEIAAVGTGPAVSDDQLTFTDELIEVRKTAVQRTKDIIDFASRFHAPVNIGKLRGNISENHPEQSWEWMRECFMEVCEYAERSEINIVLEPQNVKNINNINTTLQAVSFLEEMNLPNFHLMLDIYHMSFEQTSISTSFNMAKKWLKHLHFADSNRGAPGHGTFDYTEIMRTLKSIQYNGYLSMEVSFEKDRFKEAKEAVTFLSSCLDAE